MRPAANRLAVCAIEMTFSLAACRGRGVGALQVHRLGKQGLHQSANQAIEAIRTAANSHLSITPYSYRKVGPRPTLRELMVPFGFTGYILRFDIRTPEWVLVMGARRQREEDFH
jgi:hypothetical protein